MPDDILEINLGGILGALEAPSTQQVTLYIPKQKKCEHTFSMSALFSDEDAPLFGGECHFYCKFRV